MLNIRQYLFNNVRISLAARSFATSKTIDEPVIKYTDTINLPNTKFPARLNEEARRKVAKQLEEVRC